MRRGTLSGIPVEVNTFADRFYCVAVK